MSKFCLQCGRQLDDQAVQCTYCGAPQTMNNGFTPIPAPDGAVPKKSRTGLIIFGMAAVAVLGVVTAVLLYFFVFNDKSDTSEKANTCETPIEHYLHFLETGDKDDLDYVIPDYTRDSENYDDLVESLQNYQEKSGIEKITYSILDKEEMTDDEIKQIEATIKKNLDIDVDIEEGCKVEVKTTTKSDKMSAENEKLYFYNCKLNGKWFIFDHKSIE